MALPALLRLSAVLAIGVAASQSRADPRADYLLHCGGCHLADGRGAPPEVPTLIATLGPIVSSQEGRDYIVRVPGASQTPLSDEQLAAVMNWVLTGFNVDTLDANFRPLTGIEVGKARRRVLADPLRYRGTLWPDYD
ncbi:MAG TPA: cytochrome c [Woeseiaceae bacterium]|nr:cytochrome c [Woeseiaceae bacterium]